MKRNTPKSSYNPTPEDYAMRSTFADALFQTETIPEMDRWAFVVELLPESFWRYILRSSRLPEAIFMECVGYLAILVVEAFFQEAKDVQLFRMAVSGLLMVAVVEMESKYLHFCTSVEPSPNPFLMNLMPAEYFHPKNPETFVLAEVMEYYAEMSMEPVSE